MLLQKPGLLLIDAYNFIFRCFYSGATTPNLVIRNLLKIVAQFSPMRPIMVADSGGKTWRHDLMQSYKQNRNSTPQELSDMLTAIPELVKQNKIEWLCASGWEADDIIYTLVEKNQDQKVVIVACDKDLIPLVTYPHVELWDSIQKKFLKENDIVKKFGVKPSMIADFLALAGDGSDNIPGVPRIGTKTAAELLNKYGPLKTILENLPNLPNDPKLNLLRANRDLAVLSLELTTLREADIPLLQTVEKHTSPTEDVIKEARETGWMIFTDSSIASCNHWAICQITSLSLEEEEIVLLHNNAAPELVSQLKNTEDIGILHHLLYGALPPTYRDQEIHNLATLWQTMRTDLRNFKCSRAYHMCDRHLPPVLEAMHNLGAPVDPVLLNELKEEISTQVNTIEQEIYELAGETFLISSPQQLSRILRYNLRLTDSKKTDTVTLDSMIAHPILDKIREFRHLQKLLNTYISPIQKMAVNERIRTFYTITATKTGRLSSRNPNLQNVPTRTEAGQKLRGVFRAKPGKTLVACDYDQMELRILAHMGKIPELVDAFHRNIDWHTHISQVLFGDTNHRREAKSVTFGLIYGMSSFGLSKGLKVSLEEGKAIKNAYYDRFPALANYQRQMIEFAKSYGYVETLWGRRCYVSGGEQMARQALNYVIQGTAADIVKRSMLLLHDQEVPLILQIHDELVAETEDDKTHEICEIMRSCMEYDQLDVPMTVNISTGRSWDNMQKLMTEHRIRKYIG